MRAVIAAVPRTRAATALICHRRLRAIVQQSAFETGVPVARVYSPERTAGVVRARFAAIWAMRAATRASLPGIADHLGYADHTTVIYALRRAERLRASDPAFRTLTTRLLDAAIEGAKL